MNNLIIALDGQNVETIRYYFKCFEYINKG